MTYLRLGLKHVLAAISIIILSFALFFLVKEVFAWTNPSQSPPGGSGVITASGNNVGIGTTPAVRLEVFDATDSILRITRSGAANPTTFRLGTDSVLVVSNSGIDTLTLKSGQVGIGATNPGYKLDVLGGGRFTGDVILGDGAGTDLTVGGGAGKITVGTVDPIYSIAGLRYATYLPGMTGQREETTGILILSQNELCGDPNSYCAVVDFDETEAGSDAWLFYQITDLGDNWQNLVVLLTPASDGKVWYKKEPENNRLLVFGSKEGEVSYRFTAPRFDWQKWSNVSSEPYDGLIAPYKGK